MAGKKRRVDVRDPEVMTVHMVPYEEDGVLFGWVHTHGLAKLGHKELEIRNIHPIYLTRQAGKLLIHLADWIVNVDKPWSLGETVALEGDFVCTIVEEAEPMDDSHRGYWTLEPVELPACAYCGGKHAGPH